ncbi:hypothetical protein [uncultured Paracoccus sp.]|uniref:hypothetical protein n=1 Tax=uncultured Paracoccus sp. TaxID=189685 RepID=UPI00260F9814|nr:hypothetical protein [uncultured Paracoccus sp.]
MPALIGPDLQQLGPDHAIEACPVEAIIGVVDLAGERGHQRHLVGFARGERADACGKGGVIDHAAQATRAAPAAKAPLARQERGRQG